MLILRISLIFAVFFLPVAAAGAAVDNPFARTISFSDGSSIAAFEWFDDNNILLYTVNPHGSILWKHNIHDGTRSKIISATQLAELFPPRTDISKLKLSVSPGRRYLLFYENFRDPGNKPFFEIIDVSGNAPVLVKFTNIPPEFWVNKFAWDPSDQYLYVSNVPYLFPNENTSVGRLSLNTDSFVGLIVKDNADLIDEMTYSNDLNALVLTCWSFRGEYPKERYILKFDFYSNALEILGLFPFVHNIFITQQGDSVYFSLVGKDTNNDGFLDWLDESDISRFNLAKKENQVMLRYSGFVLEPRVTNSGKWLGYLRIPERIGRRPTAYDTRQLWIMQIEDRREIFVTEDCISFLFSNDSRKVLALKTDRSRLEVFELPN